MRPAACGGTKDAKFAATKNQRSVFRLRACQKYFFDTLRPAALQRAFSRQNGETECEISQRNAELREKEQCSQNRGAKFDE